MEIVKTHAKKGKEKWTRVVTEGYPRDGKGSKYRHTKH